MDCEDWGETSPSAIQKCFRVGGFPSTESECDDEDDDLPLSTLVKNLNGNDEDFINLDHLIATEDDSDGREEVLLNGFRPSDIDEPVECGIEDVKEVDYNGAMEAFWKLDRTEEWFATLSTEKFANRLLKFLKENHICR